MTTTTSYDSGDRSHTMAPIESVAQISTALRDTDPTLDPRLAALARQAAADGVVLLRNDRGALPLTGRVALFGRVQLDWFAVGYGSGGDVKVPYVWNLLAGLRDAGVQVDDELADRYTAWTAANRPPITTEWGRWPHHFPEMPVTAALTVETAARNDVAVVVIGRAAGEARDSLLEPGSYYLTADETDLLDRVTATFERTVVVLDAGNVMDLGWLATYGERIAGVLYAWQGGMEGARAVAAVLAGEISPSGRLTDTIAASYADYPSAELFGDPAVSVYAEDVFVGYRYFETFAPERVLFPFGFGLGYAAFEHRVTDASIRAPRVVFTVDVVNTGRSDHSGRETVQLYVAKPGTALAEPARHLAAFAKTRVLAPGEHEQLTMEVDVDELASYDDGGRTGHRSSWVLEAGEYRFFLGTDVRTARHAGSLVLDELRVVRRVQEAAAVDPSTPFERMTSRTDAAGSPTIAWEPAPTATVSRRERVLSGLPAAITAHAADPATPTASAAAPGAGDVFAGGSAARGIHLDEVASGSATLDEFIAQLSIDELAALSRGDVIMDSPLGTPGNAGVLGGVSPSLRAKGVRPVTTADGPSGIRLSSYASLLPSGTALASTWDPALVRELSALHGEELVRKGADVLLSPGMNLHRNPLCGRNFEYFAEDPLLTGRMAAAVVAGVQSKGVAACPKHFAANNQEESRTVNDSRVSERALRELYLRGFEICVREAAPASIMTSYNKVNGVWAHYHHDLVTTILRGEWGYEGCVITDWWMEQAVDPDFPALEDSAYRVRAQVDVLMPGGVKSRDVRQPYPDRAIETSVAQPDGLTLGELHRGARNVLRLVLALAPLVDARADAPTDAAPEGSR